MRAHIVSSFLVATLLLGGCSYLNETDSVSSGPVVPVKPVDVSDYLSSPQVEVYSLNRAAPAMGGRQNAYQVERRIVPVDNRVTIYSLEPVPAPVSVAQANIPSPPPAVQPAYTPPPAYVPAQQPTLPDFVTPVDTSTRAMPVSVKEPPVVAAEKPMTAKPETAKTDSFAPARIYFTGEQADLDDEDKSVIATVAKSLKKKKNVKLQVNGHALSSNTDPDVRHVQSMEIAKQRAFNVAQELIKNGIPAENIQADSWGDMQPALLTPGIDPNAANQRVEIILKK